MILCPPTPEEIRNARPPADGPTSKWDELVPLWQRTPSSQVLRMIVLHSEVLLRKLWGQYKSSANDLNRGFKGASTDFRRKSRAAYILPVNSGSLSTSLSASLFARPAVGNISPGGAC